MNKLFATRGFGPRANIAYWHVKSFMISRRAHTRALNLWKDLRNATQGYTLGGI